MKTLRYLLMMVAVLSVLGLSAQTPKYGRTYNPQHKQAVYTSVQAQMPQATMSSTSTMMSSGSTLPQAAVSGVVTTANYAPAKAPVSRPRKVGEDDGFENEDEPDVPVNPNPIGDGLWALMLLAIAFAFGRGVLRKRAIR
jgi:hypothetical protein